jgi:phosphoribosylaminoimidazole (AIR) synthetase
MARVFNLGLGLLAVVPRDQVARAREAVPGALVVGAIVERPDGVTIRP